MLNSLSIRLITPFVYNDVQHTLRIILLQRNLYKLCITGNYRWKTSLDRETGVMTIHFEQSLWEKYVSCIFYPYDNLHEILKKDEIKEVYVDKDGTTTTIWEASEEEQKAYLSEEHTEPLG